MFAYPWHQERAKACQVPTSEGRLQEAMDFLQIDSTPAHTFVHQPSEKLAELPFWMLSWMEILEWCEPLCWKPWPYPDWLLSLCFLILFCWEKGTHQQACGTVETLYNNLHQARPCCTTNKSQASLLPHSILPSFCELAMQKCKDSSGRQMEFKKKTSRKIKAPRNTFLGLCCTTTSHSVAFLWEAEWVLGLARELHCFVSKMPFQNHIHYLHICEHFDFTYLWFFKNTEEINIQH